jgi:hypothetical protein
MFWIILLIAVLCLLAGFYLGYEYGRAAEVKARAVADAFKASANAVKKVL